jgi:hypothetical protein
VIGVAVSKGVGVGSSADAVGAGDGVSDGRGVPVIETVVFVIGTLVYVASVADIVEAADGVADSAGAVQASAIIKSMKSRIKKRFLCDITSSATKFLFKIQEHRSYHKRNCWFIQPDR